MTSRTSGRLCKASVLSSSPISVFFTTAITSQEFRKASKYVRSVFSVITANRHCTNPKARNDSVSERAAMRRAFLCALRAFPASSPSTPNRSFRIREFFPLFSPFSAAPRTASRGVRRLNALAGIQAERNTVTNVPANARTRIAGWSEKGTSIRPSMTPSAKASVHAISPALPRMPSSMPDTAGRALKANASFKSPLRSCPGAAPTLARMPSS